MRRGGWRSAAGVVVAQGGAVQPLAPLEPLAENPKLRAQRGPGSSNTAAAQAQSGQNSRRASHSGSGRPDPLSTITHASASRIGPGVIPTGLKVVAHDQLSPEDKAKRLAAYAAVDEHVKDHHKVLGIGSGSTVPYVVERLCQPPHSYANSDRWYIPTGFQSKELIVKAGLNLGDVDQFPTIDVTIDGADEVDDELNAIKGGGACQLREKVLAEAATHFIIVADSRKDSKVLGTNWKQGVPIEVAPFAWAKVFVNLQKMGCEKPLLRMGKMKAGPVVTDNGNFVIDAVFSESYMRDPAELLHRIKMLTGVLEVGLFTGMAEAAYFGYPDGTVMARWQDGRRHTVDASEGLAIAAKGEKV